MSNFRLYAPTPVVHIHIPKTGGSSIRIGMWEKRYDGPIYGHIPQTWENDWKFALIRHPMSRWWSAYRDFQQYHSYKGYPDDFAAETLAQEGVARFGSIAHHTQPYTDLQLCLDRADAVYRYETEYEQCVSDVLHRSEMRAPKEMPRLRETQPTTNPELSKKMERRLVDFYKADFAEFNYEPW